MLTNEEEKEETQIKDHNTEMEDIRNDLKKLTVIEREYFRDWLMNEYPILAMAHDIDTMMWTIDGVGADYEKVKELLNGIHDHTKWGIEESIYLEENADLIAIENKLQDLSKIERIYFNYWLNSKYHMEVANCDCVELIDMLLESRPRPDYQEINEMLNNIHDLSNWNLI